MNLKFLTGLFALTLVACQNPNQPTQPNDVRQNQTVNVITGGSPPPSCPGVQQVSTNVPSSVKVNVAVPIKVSSGNGGSCDAQASPAWSTGQPCEVSSAGTVDTILTCTATGSAPVTGCLSGICNTTNVEIVQ